MNGRAIIAIGCNSYDHNEFLPDLECAENDAKELFVSLIKPEVGDYDHDLSKCLMSPTSQDVRDALKEVLFSGRNVDVLTFIFAGHGLVHKGSYYLATKDSSECGISATSIALSEVLRIIGDASPKQSYIFIDACESGGLIYDIDPITRSDILGKAGSPGITLFATSASDEEALEQSGHGIASLQLLKCINGETLVNDHSPVLDLIEIGRKVSDIVSSQGLQTPVVSGLNIYGPASFCKNPFIASVDIPLRSVLRDWSDPTTTSAIRQLMPALWKPFVTIKEEWDSHDFIERLSPILSEVKNNNHALIDITARIMSASSSQAQQSHDSFRNIEVKAACITALGKYANSQEVADYVLSESLDLSRCIDIEIQAILEKIRVYRFSLVTGGLSDVFYLPIRISKLMGWAGLCVNISSSMNVDTERYSQNLKDLFEAIRTYYPLCISSVADQQSTYLFSAMIAAKYSNLNEQAEEIMGRMYSSIIECNGKISKYHINPARVLEYVRARGSSVKPKFDLLAQPCELITAVMLLSQIFDLQGEIDPYLILIDKIDINGFVPKNIEEFFEPQMSFGVNACYEIGCDVWTVSELDESFPYASYDVGVALKVGAMISSLVYGDRIPWFMLPLYK